MSLCFYITHASMSPTSYDR